MNTVMRDKFIFNGPRAEDSAQYYDTVISSGFNDDMIYLAWDSAHKFGTRMTSEGIASFKNGVVFGGNALLAAEFIDNEYSKVYASCEEFGRSKRMKQLMLVIYAMAKEKYHVDIKLF